MTRARTHTPSFLSFALNWVLAAMCAGWLGALALRALLEALL